MWILMRKLAIMFVKVVLVDQALAQIYWGIWIIATSLVAHIRYSPYSKKVLWRLEALSLIATFMILMVRPAVGVGVGFDWILFWCFFFFFFFFVFFLKTPRNLLPFPFCVLFRLIIPIV